MEVFYFHPRENDSLLFHLRYFHNGSFEPRFYGFKEKYLTIIPRARMGSDSIVHEAEGRMGY